MEILLTIKILYILYFFIFYKKKYKNFLFYLDMNIITEEEQYNLWSTKCLPNDFKPTYNSNCEELLNKIKYVLHKCKDDTEIIKISDKLDITNCKNISKWSKDVRNTVGLKLDIRNPIITDIFVIDYKVNKKKIIISPIT
jgi:hypothetical protein